MQHDKGQLKQRGKLYVMTTSMGAATPPINTISLNVLWASNLSSNLSGGFLALKPKMLHVHGILHWQDPEGYTAEGPSTGTDQHGGLHKQYEGQPKRGTCAGIDAKLKANPYKPVLPSSLLANFRSLENKIHYLWLDWTSQCKVKDCCALIITSLLDNANSIIQATPNLDQAICESGKDMAKGSSVSTPSQLWMN